jgi:hypothetical protein
MLQLTRVEAVPESSARPRPPEACPRLVPRHMEAEICLAPGVLSEHGSHSLAPAATPALPAWVAPNIRGTRRLPGQLFPGPRFPRYSPPPSFRGRGLKCSVYHKLRSRPLQGCLHLLFPTRGYGTEPLLSPPGRITPLRRPARPYLMAAAAAAKGKNLLWPGFSHYL